MAPSITLTSYGLLALSTVGRVLAQTTTPYTDPNTGITFSGLTNEHGYTFGIALPEENAGNDAGSADFIGQISANITSGWAGVSLTDHMRNALLVVAYPAQQAGDDQQDRQQQRDQNQVTASLRQTKTYNAPTVFESENNGTNPSLQPIPEGVFTNSTAFTYTFLCKSCILGDHWTFNSSTDSTPASGVEGISVLGWALSTVAVEDPEDPAAVIGYHDYFGKFGANITGARSSSFAEWAGMAAGSDGNSTSGGSSGGGCDEGSKTSTDGGAASGKRQIWPLLDAATTEAEAEAEAEAEDVKNEMEESQQQQGQEEDQALEKRLVVDGVPQFRRPIKPMMFNGRVVAAADDDDEYDDEEQLYGGGNEADRYDYLNRYHGQQKQEKPFQA